MVVNAMKAMKNMMVNTIQTDLKSDNYLEVSMALSVVTKLINTELVPVIFPAVVKLLEHIQVTHLCHHAAFCRGQPSPA